MYDQLFLNVFLLLSFRLENKVGQVHALSSIRAIPFPFLLFVCGRSLNHCFFSRFFHEYIVGIRCLREKIVGVSFHKKRVHKAGQTLALLTKGDCVGEMALLDYSPRSADVTVKEDATLLRIGREDFNEVMAANPEIMQAIVRLLVRRLREANEKLTGRPDGAIRRNDAVEDR